MARFVLIRDGGQEHVVPETALPLEANLHDALTSHPELLQAEDMNLGRTGVVGRESAFASGYADLILLDDRLASVMVALECLFVLGRSEGTKGALIAERLTERFRLREMTPADQAAWLRRLYAARNDAVHEGRDYVNDLDVDRLVDVTRSVIQSLAVHLIPAHRANGRSCRTYEQAMRCSRP